MSNNLEQNFVQAIREIIESKFSLDESFYEHLRENYHYDLVGNNYDPPYDEKEVMADVEEAVYAANTIEELHFYSDPMEVYNDSFESGYYTRKETA